MQTGQTEKAIEIRAITDIEEMVAVEQMQRTAWGVDDLAIVPRTQLSAAVHVGGTLLGAFDKGRLVGFAYGFYGLLNERPVHHSHMLAVDPEYRNHDLGFRLKVEQLQRVRADAFADRITWTFDPLRSLNAHFNFGKLGVVADTYIVDLYGGDASSFLHRTGTDRLFVTWLITSQKVKDIIHGETKAAQGSPDRRFEAERLVRMSVDRFPVRSGEVLGQRYLVIEIPADIGEIERKDLETAVQWRKITRRAFLDALKAGFIVTGYSRMSEESGAYLLERTTVS